MNDHDVSHEISPVTLKTKLEKGDNLLVLDVREPHEIKICTLNNSMNIPLGDLRFRIQELEAHKNKEIIVYCRSGKRSAMAAEFLRENGFSQVINLAGGILAWSDQVDPSCQKY